jgi:hypothetical protein
VFQPCFFVMAIGVTLFPILKRIGPKQEVSRFPAIDLKELRGVKRQVLPDSMSDSFRVSSFASSNSASGSTSKQRAQSC